MGSRGGDFLGYVDRQPSGEYRAFDARSSVIGDFSILAEATAAVSAASPDDDAPSAEDLQGTVR
ncbi:hypothetical protein [Microbacterium sp. GCS4]|uniref:hypothetical protein n=1 Tax=Microbacterium sp. GCS4 TaxID=1692239 RepID=UPI001F2142F5|nr:hypothetical protein [Microbacterium sp. GCS4]